MFSRGGSNEVKVLQLLESYTYLYMSVLLPFALL